jgi:hypothetical protein
MKLKEKFIVNEQGKKTGVIIDIEKYRELLEDIEDLMIIAERKTEPTISIEELKKRLKKNGII